MERCEKRAFQLLEMRKNENQLKHKIQVRNRLFVDSKVFGYDDLYLSLRGEHIKANIYINFIKINVKFEILFTRKRVFKHKEVVYNLHVCCNGVGKM